MDTSSQKKAPITIDFDLHTDGDEEFKRELVTLMIDNMKELQESLRQSIARGTFQLFRECCHKITPTINILDYKQFTDVINEIKNEVDENKRKNAIATCNQLSEEIITSLQHEIA